MRQCQHLGGGNNWPIMWMHAAAQRFPHSPRARSNGFHTRAPFFVPEVQIELSKLLSKLRNCMMVFMVVAYAFFASTSVIPIRTHPFPPSAGAGIGATASVDEPQLASALLGCGPWKAATRSTPLNIPLAPWQGRVGLARYVQAASRTENWTATFQPVSDLRNS